MILESVIKKLSARIDSSRIRENEKMDKHTSFRAGGCADIFIEPGNLRELKWALEVLSNCNVEYMIMGNGSNILVRDGGYRGALIKIGETFNHIDVEGDTISCGAGALMSSVSAAALENGLTGFEFASGIPGSIGGAVFMNAGAYDGEVKNVLKEAIVMNRRDFSDKKMYPEQLDMGYRHTAIHETGDIVLEVKLQLQTGDRESIRSRIAELTEKRNSKQPVSYPSAGSFFKRPDGYFAGKLIQDSGLKGLTVGGAQVSELHSGFIINRGGATATDILQLMEIVQERVYDEFDVMLEPEVRIIGE